MADDDGFGMDDSDWMVYREMVSRHFALQHYDLKSRYSSVKSRC